MKLRIETALYPIRQAPATQSFKKIVNKLTFTHFTHLTHLTYLSHLYNVESKELLLLQYASTLQNQERI